MATRVRSGKGDALRSAREAAARGDSESAATILRPLRAELEADQLELLAEAEWWLGNLDACIEVRTQAYERAIAAGQRVEAAGLALKLAADSNAKLASSQAQGWHRRANRLLKDEPEGPMHGRLLLQGLWAHYRREDPDEAIGVATTAEQIAERHDDRDLQASALMELGRLLLHSGRAGEAMPLIEEACAAAVGGELSRFTTGTVFCQAIVTFQELTDYGRASEWADAATRWCERRELKGFPGLCRMHRAEAMRLRGAWADASVQAEQACAELVAFAPAWARAAFRELAIIRLRLGDLDGAERAVEESRAIGSAGQPSLAMVWLAKGRPDAALAGLQETLRAEDWSDLDRAPLLAVLVEAALLSRDIQSAQNAADELQQTAERYGTDVLSATAAEAAGRVALARSDGSAAVAHLQRALKHFTALDLPYETARARTVLAMAYQLAGEGTAARQELATAAALFQRLGAAADAETVRDLISQIDRPRQQRATLMFTDICGSTSLVEAMGDEAWSDAVAWHDTMLRRLFSEFGGTELDHAGDGFFVAFDDAATAVRCAMAIQRTLRQHRREHGFAPHVRIGLHEADATRAGQRLRGKGVHAAARIGAAAEAGEILASITTLDGTGPGVVVDRRETLRLKGLTQPVDVASVAWR